MRVAGGRQCLTHQPKQPIFDLVKPRLVRRAGKARAYLPVMNSVLSHPVRGSGGDPGYRGNCGGNFLREVLGHYRPNFVLDPMCGSGTTGDVCRELNIRYQGFDLRGAFNLLRDRLADRLTEAPDYIFTHPTYHDMVRYSGPDGVWGREEKGHPDDLSNCASAGGVFGEVAACPHERVRTAGAGGPSGGPHRRSEEEQNLSQLSGGCHSHGNRALGGCDYQGPAQYV